MHGCKLSVIPKTNTAFWSEKLRKNAERDSRNTSLLENAGWKVFTVWECDIERDLGAALKDLVEYLEANKTRR